MGEIQNKIDECRAELERLAETRVGLAEAVSNAQRALRELDAERLYVSDRLRDLEKVAG